MIDYDLYREIQIAAYGEGSFNNKPNYLNLFGIRKNTTIPDAFDDLIGAAFLDSNGEKQIVLFPATTDPGLYWLNNPSNVAGTGILCPQFIRHFWIKGLHKGYSALVQNSSCYVFRDNNRDNQLDYKNKMLALRESGFNLHRAAASGTTGKVNKWSAGCQVLAKASDFLILMSLRDKQIKTGYLYFNYTLWYNLVTE